MKIEQQNEQHRKNLGGSPKQSTIAGSFELLIFNVIRLKYFILDKIVIS